MPEVIEFQRNEYRTQGGEIYRRPAERDHLSPGEAAWVVLKQGEKRFVPDPVRNHLAQRQKNLRFD